MSHLVTQAIIILEGHIHSTQTYVCLKISEIFEKLCRDNEMHTSAQINE